MGTELAGWQAGTEDAGHHLHTPAGNPASPNRANAGALTLLNAPLGVSVSVTVPPFKPTGTAEATFSCGIVVSCVGQ